MRHHHWNVIFHRKGKTAVRANELFVAFGIVGLLFRDGCKKASSAVGTDKKFRKEDIANSFFLE